MIAKGITFLIFVCALSLIVPAPIQAATADPTIADLTTAVQAMLTRRAAALTNGDKQAFLATVDPNAPAAFKAEQATLFDGFRSVPFKGYALRVDTADTGDFAPGLDLQKKYGAQAAFFPETRQTYELADYDDRPAVDTLYLTYVERNGRWYVAANNDGDVLGLQSSINLWDDGPLAVRRTPHFLVLTEPDQVARGQAIATIAESAMATFNSRWNLPWSGKIPLVVPASAAETAKLLRTTSDVANFAAFVSFAPVRDDGWAISAPRIFSQDANLSQVPVAVQAATLVHELTHAATAALSGPFTPTWMQEGLAEYERFDRPTNRDPEPGKPVVLPDASDFVSNDRDTLDTAYRNAAAAMSYLASVKGKDAPAALFSATGALRITAGSPSYNIDQAMRSVYGAGLGDFQSQWAAASPK